MVGREGKWRERSEGIVGWQQIVLGVLDKLWEGKGGERSGGIVCWQQIFLRRIW